MHVLAILVFLLALLAAGEVIRSTLAANGVKIFAALAGEARATSLTFPELSVVPFPAVAQRRAVSSPALPLPLAA